MEKEEITEQVEVNGKTVEVITGDEGIEVRNTDNYEFSDEEKSEIENKILQLPFVQKKNMEINKFKKMAEQQKLESGNSNTTINNGNVPESTDQTTMLMSKLGLSSREDLSYFRAENPAEYAEALVEVREHLLLNRIIKESSKQATETALLNSLAQDGYDSTEAVNYIKNLLGAQVTQNTIDAYRATHQKLSKSIGDIQAEKQQQKVTWVDPGKNKETKNPLVEMAERVRDKLNSGGSAGRYKF